MRMYHYIEYSDNYSKTSGHLWPYYRDEPALTDASDIDNTPGNSVSFKFKEKITGQIGNDGTTDAEIMLPLKYLSNFWRTLEMPLINCENNLILTWSANCFIEAENANNQVPIFAISDTNLYAPVVTLSTQCNVKQL